MYKSYINVVKTTKVISFPYQAFIHLSTYRMLGPVLCGSMHIQTHNHQWLLGIVIGL